jgi:hypothetical protein
MMKNGFYSAAAFPGSTALPFVISTGAPKERIGEICGLPIPINPCTFCGYTRS